MTPPIRDTMSCRCDYCIATMLMKAREEERLKIYNEAIILVMPGDDKCECWPTRRKAILDTVREM